MTSRFHNSVTSSKLFYLNNNMMRADKKCASYRKGNNNDKKSSVSDSVFQKIKKYQEKYLTRGFEPTCMNDTIDNIHEIDENESQNCLENKHIHDTDQVVSSIMLDSDESALKSYFVEQSIVVAYQSEKNITLVQPTNINGDHDEKHLSADNTTSSGKDTVLTKSCEQLINNETLNQSMDNKVQEWRENETIRHPDKHASNCIALNRNESTDEDAEIISSTASVEVETSAQAVKNTDIILSELGIISKGNKIKSECEFSPLTKHCENKLKKINKLTENIFGNEFSSSDERKKNFEGSLYEGILRLDSDNSVTLNNSSNTAQLEKNNGLEENTNHINNYLSEKNCKEYCNKVTQTSTPDLPIFHSHLQHAARNLTIFQESASVNPIVDLLSAQNKSVQTTTLGTKAIDSEKDEHTSIINRIIREQISMTKHFLASQRTMYEAYCRSVENLSANYKPVTLEDTKNFIKKNRRKKWSWLLNHE